METQRLVEANTLKMLNEIKREIRELSQVTPEFAGNEYDFCELTGAMKAFEKCIQIINEKIEQVK
jgi:hypothetical protein